MRTTAILATRFEELQQQAEAIEATKRYENSEYFSGERIDQNLLLNWKVKAKHLLSIACGSESEHYKQFVETGEPQAYRSNYEELKSLSAVFQAAGEDFNGGYISTFRGLVQAEVFSEELDQATELLKNGYTTAAAVVAGTVLETALRQLCIAAGLGVGKLDKMNADLAKAGSYNLLVQKRITALADVRNNAAHGKPDQFSKTDVADMIAYVGLFLADRIS